MREGFSNSIGEYMDWFYESIVRNAAIVHWSIRPNPLKVANDVILTIPKHNLRLQAWMIGTLSGMMW